MDFTHDGSLAVSNLSLESFTVLRHHCAIRKLGCLGATERKTQVSPQNTELCLFSVYLVVGCAVLFWFSDCNKVGPCRNVVKIRSLGCL